MIRQAVPEDAAFLAPLLYDAIHDIAYTLTGATTKNEAVQRLAYWIQQPANRIGFENTWVYCVDEQPVGMMILYPGFDAVRLDRPLLHSLQQQGQLTEFDQETEGDVFYIDTLSVHPSYGGRGIGSTLLHHAEHLAHHKNINCLSLNVDFDNLAAQRLYERLGYREHSTRTISGGQFSYMTKSLSQPKTPSSL